MVTFKLKEKRDNRFIYEYFPEGDFTKNAGIIVVDTVAESVFIEKVAERDFERRTTAKELNQLRDTVNVMRAENGEPLLTEEEWPTAKKGSRWYFYADHAIRELCDLFNSGKEPTEGMAMWY